MVTQPLCRWERGSQGTVIGPQGSVSLVCGHGEASGLGFL